MEAPHVHADGHTTVLLVDDQPFVGEAVRRLIADEPDLTFHFEPSARAAVDLARRLQPTVILQDLVMPHVEGLELVRRYRAGQVDERVQTGILISINGIAAGLRNTG